MPASEFVPNEVLRLYPPSNTPSGAKPTFVLVHGGWHSPVAWTYVIPLLEKAGYSTYPMSLVSMTAQPPVSDWSGDVEVVRSAVDSLLQSGKDVVVVLFSYAGVVGCEALKAFHDEHHHGSSQSHDGQSASTSPLPSPFNEPRRGKILHIAFVAAYILPVGESLWGPTKPQKMPGFLSKDRWLHLLDGPDRFFNDLPRPVAEYWASTLKPHSLLAFYSKLTYPAYLYYPCSYLLCTDDKALPPKIQERMASLADIPRDRITRVKSAHMVMISQPGAVAKFLRKAAGEASSVL